YMGGATGAGHSAEFHIVDTMLGYVLPAKALASMAIDLLAEGGAGAREGLKTAKPAMTREGYLAFQRGIARPERVDAAARPPVRRRRTAGCSGALGERTAQQTPGQGAGMLAVAQQDLAVHHGGRDAPAALGQPLGAGGEVADHLGHLRPDGVRIEDHEVGRGTPPHQSATGQGPARRRGEPG